jgi:signal transduction histidine kinase
MRMPFRQHDHHGFIDHGVERSPLDYTPAGGGVYVTSRRCDAELRIEVRDTGVGIRANRR